MQSRLPHLSKIQLDIVNKDISILNGADMPQPHINCNVVLERPNKPNATLKKLGWVVLIGKTKNVKSQTKSSGKWRVKLRYPKRTHFFFCQKLTHYALQILKSTTSKEKDRYSIRPLWKDDKPILPYNRNMTISRMLSLERKFEKQLSLKSKYVEIINENKEKGHARKLPHKAKMKSSITSHTKS